MDWSERVADVLNTPEISFGRSFYGPGELSEAPIVITVSRVSDDDYRQLADGDADVRLVLHGDL